MLNDFCSIFRQLHFYFLCEYQIKILVIKMDAPFQQVNLFNTIIALYIIGQQLTICVDWSWIPINEEDYQLPYQDKWSVNQQ